LWQQEQAFPLKRSLANRENNGEIKWQT